MDIIVHNCGDRNAAEIISGEILIRETADALYLMADLRYQGFDSLILHEKNLNPDFFNLKSGLAGDILQKFSTYNVRIAIIGDFSKYPGKSLRDFIYESNNGKQVFFLGDKETAVRKLLSV